MALTDPTEKKQPYDFLSQKILHHKNVSKDVWSTRFKGKFQLNLK